MTEKQRWLLKDLEMWERRQMERIGRYGPKPLPLSPDTQTHCENCGRPDVPLVELECRDCRAQDGRE